METKIITISCDHAGFPYKEAIVEKLTELGFEVLNFGTNNLDSMDYPDVVHPAMAAIEEGKAHMGVLICGSGNGVAITANKHQGIRAALCWDIPLAGLARQHNNANVIAIPARFVSENLALEMVEVFMTTDFEGGRHANRVAKIAC